MRSAFGHFAFLFFVLILPSCASKGPSKSDSVGAYTYSTDYFSMHIPVWEKNLSHLKNKKNIKYLELGVYEGRSFFWTLQNILKDQTSSAVAVDIFPENLFKVFEQNLKVSGEEKRVKVYKGYFNDVLPQLPRDSFDLIYLDGGHMSWTTLETSMLAWPLLKKDGLIIFDDYKWNSSKWPAQNSPKIAIDAFLQTHKNFIEIVHKSEQVIVKKVETACDLWGTYACTPLNDWAYYWQRRGLFNVVKNQEIALSEKQSRELEAILNSPQYAAAADVKELADLAKNDKKLNSFLRAFSK